MLQQSKFLVAANLILECCHGKYSVQYRSIILHGHSVILHLSTTNIFSLCNHFPNLIYLHNNIFMVQEA